MRMLCYFPGTRLITKRSALAFTNYGPLVCDECALSLEPKIFRVFSCVFTSLRMQTQTIIRTSARFWECRQERRSLISIPIIKHHSPRSCFQGPKLLTMMFSHSVGWDLHSWPPQTLLPALGILPFWFWVQSEWIESPECFTTL